MGQASQAVRLQPQLPASGDATKQSKSSTRAQSIGIFRDYRNACASADAQSTSTMPLHKLHVVAITLLAASHPIGRLSMVRPRMALRMIMKGPAKTQSKAPPRLSESVSAERANCGGRAVIICERLAKRPAATKPATQK